MDSEKSGITIAIVGGGIGGVTTGIALGRAGYSVHLFEQASEFAELGFGIGVTPNVIRALEGLGILDTYSKVAETYPDGSTWIRYVSWLDSTDVANVKAVGSMSFVHRKRLLEALVSLLPPNVEAHFSTRVIRVQNVAPDASGQDGFVSLDVVPVRPNHDRLDGEGIEDPETRTFKADAVIGADGVKSIIREQVLPDARLRWMGTYSYRALLPMGRVKELNGDWAAETCMWIGPGKLILAFPVEHGAFVNFASIVRDHSKSTWEGPWVKPVDKKTLMDEFCGWNHLATNLVKLVDKPEQWALHEVAPLSRWTNGRVALLGDSAHASGPFNAGGAGQAIEDAYVLGELLSLPECNKKTLPRFLQAYEDVRRPRATAQQLHAIESGKLMTLEGDYSEDLERVGKDLHTRFHWIWKHDLSVDVEAAKTKLRDEGVLKA